MNSSSAAFVDEAGQASAPDGHIGRMLFFIGVPRFPEALAPPLLAFYRLHRAARAIVDDPALFSEQKTVLLDGAITALGGGPSVTPDVPAAAPLLSDALRDFVQVSREAGADPRHAAHVMQAFRQDLTKTRYRDWGEFFAYCRYAAAPVARYAFEACGEQAAAGQSGAEALCCAWQVLASLQGASRDYRLHNRVYLPERWFKDRGAAVEDLGREAATPALRAVFADGIQAVARLLHSAKPLPGAIRHRRLRGALAANIYLAGRFARRFTTTDPLAVPPHVGRGDRTMAGIYGLARRWM